ncbi:DMT family transporter [Bacillus sp. 1NLA3E]|uniref:DMT family transporter n=1 Tax=Bacillus sp. 1NLA3E TaxID=666686 RepID=UPI000247F2C1|nr:DMT family transporter [Bacillus sp. 1NLA3E]AGK53899.1 DMT(drug/metabolite transporter) superfamily permease [Bacillus sp. 1NLA3E]
MKSIYQNKWAVIIIAIFCSLLWGSAFPVLKISYQELHMAPDDTMAKIVFAGMRFLIAGIIILVFLLFTNRNKLVVRRSQILVLVVFGIIQTAIQYFFFYNGLAKVSGMQGSILTSTGTFLAVFLAHFYYKDDKMNGKKAIGILAGITGIIVANWGQEFQFQFQWTGEGYMILSALTSAITTIMAKELATDIDPITLTGWQLTIGSILLLIIGLPQLGPHSLTFTPFSLGLLIYAAVISSVAFAMWFSILKYNKAGEMSIYNFLTPVFGAFLSAMFIPGERLNLYILAAIALVAIGIIAINYNGREKKAIASRISRKIS